MASEHDARRSMRRRAGRALTAGLAPALVACNAILGTPEAILASADGGVDGATVSVVAMPEGGSPLDGSPSPPDAGDSGADAEAAPPTCHADVTRDSSNCGACGHDCQGATCTNGHCDPRVIAGSPTSFRRLASLYGIAVIGNRVYGTDWYQDLGALWATPAYASVTEPAPIFSPNGADGSVHPNVAADPVVTDGQTLYFSVYQEEGTGIYAVTPDGHGTRIATTPYVGTMAVDAAHLYWASDQDGAIVVAEKANPANTRTFDVGRDKRSPIVAAGGFLFFAHDRSVRAAAPGDLALSVDYSAATRADRLASDGTWIYWFDAQANELYRAPIASPGMGKAITPATKPVLKGFEHMLLADGRSVFLSDSTLNAQQGPTPQTTFYRMRADGTSAVAEDILDLDVGVAAWTQDATTLYFTTYGNESNVKGPYSAIWRLAK